MAKAPNSRLKYVREQRGWSQKDVADKIGVPDSTEVSRWERGIVNPRPYYRQKLSELFGMSPEELGLMQSERDNDGEPHIVPQPSTTLLVSPGTEGLDLVSLDKPEEEVPVGGAERSALASPLQIPSNSSQNRAISVDSLQSETHMQLVKKQHNRTQMLKRVRTFWIKGILEHSLHHAALMTLGLHELPEAVANPWHLLIQHQEQPARPLPAGTSIAQVYHEAGGELLILGEPGAGKTTLLLELTRDLLDRAEQDPTHAIPVVFPLSSWAAKLQSLATWLVEELHLKYQVPRKVGQGWIDADELLLLLDGLDELAEPQRSACIEAINTYRRQHTLGVVVCSRRAEYQAQAARLGLQRAVLIQPLSIQQIDEYFSCAGKPLQAVQKTLHTDPEFQELLQSPLMLSIVTLTYQGQTARDLQVEWSLQDLRLQVFGMYVQRMLARRKAHEPYSAEQTPRWLTWMAQQMMQHGQTDFYIERLQLDWVSPHWFFKVLLTLSTGLLIAFFGWIVYSIFFGYKFGPAGVSTDAVLFSLFFLLIFVLVNSVILPLLAKSNPMMRASTEKGRLRSWRQVLSFLMTLLETRWGYSLLIGVPVGSFVGFLMGKAFGVMLGFAYGLFNILMLTIAFFMFDTFSIEVKLVEIVVWSWTSVWKNLRLSSLASCGFGLLMAILFSVDPHFGLKLGIPLGLFYGVGFLILSNVTYWGFSQELLQKQKPQTPNQGIRRSAKNSLVLGTLGLSLTGLFFWLTLALFGRPIEGIYYGTLAGVVVGGIAALRQGGFACFQHYAVRLLLRGAGSIPWNYVKFLDDAVEHLLLRKVGGGYIFVHRLLLEYFCSLPREKNRRTT